MLHSSRGETSSSSARIPSFLRCVGMILAGVLAAGPAQANAEVRGHYKMAASLFGIACIELSPDRTERIALLFGMTRVHDTVTLSRMLQGEAGEVYAKLDTAIFTTLVRRASGACQVAVLYGNPSYMEYDVNTLVHALRSLFPSVEEVEVPRGLPRPALRARYTLRLGPDEPARTMELQVPNDHTAILSLIPRGP